MKWKDKLISHLVYELKNDSEWKSVYEKVFAKDKSIGVHLAIFREPYLSLILNGKKTIESRFSINKISPFGTVKKGDLVVLKKTGGAVMGFFIAGDISYYPNLDSKILNKIESLYGKAICAQYDDNFWEDRSKANYATLVQVKKLKRMNPFHIEKKDRMSWVVLRKNDQLTLFTF